jgi:hypothetical protein
MIGGKNDLSDDHSYQRYYNTETSLFDLAVREEIERFLDAEVMTIEKNRLVFSDKLLIYLDRDSGCDLCISHHGVFYFAASRIAEVYPESSSMPPAITLKNSEIDGLKKRCTLNRNHNFYPAPTLMIFSRVMVVEEESFLLDMVIIKTPVLIDFLFNQRAFNLKKLRERFEKGEHDEINFLSYRTELGGIRSDNTGNTVVYLSTNLLDTFRVSYLYYKSPHPDSLIEVPEGF